MGGTITEGLSTNECECVLSAAGAQHCQFVVFLLPDGDGPAPAHLDERQPGGE